MIKLKPIFIVLLLLAAAWQAGAQQVITFSGSWGQGGFQLEQSDQQAVQVSYSIPKLMIGDIEIEGSTMKTIEMPGIFLPNEEGYPNLPGNGRFIALPKGATATVEILEVRTEVIHNLEISPAPRIPKETEDGLEYHKNLEVYTQNAHYPASPVTLSAPTQIRGVDVVMLGITPFQYNPVSKELIVYKDIRVRVHFNEGTGQVGENRLRSRWFDPLLQDMLLNPGILPKVDYNKSNINSDDIGFEYLIIVPNDAYFTSWADTIKKFRSRQGILTGIKTLAEVGGNTTAAIENYLNNAFNTWTIPPVACLLIGDYGTNAANTMVSPIWNSYCVSDNIYGDVTGNSMPDIVMARMTAQNEAQLEVMVKKFIQYERNPPSNPDFYAHPITALGWQTERWFQVCSEVIGGFWTQAQGKTPVRINAIYDGNPSVDPWSTATNTNAVVSYFGPSGLGYIPATPQGLTGWSGGTPAMVNNAINAGSFMLQHRDHGFEGGWGEPDYGSPDISDLYNTDLCFVMSINCLTGKYNHNSEVFAEKFHRYTWNEQLSGALGVIAASEVSYSFVNDAYIWGVYDNMWPEFMPAYGSTPDSRGVLPAFGNAAGKYFLQQSSWPYNTSNKEVTYNLFHHHGDAFLMVYSEVPQSLTVTHNPIIYTGETSFEVTANAGSLICLSLNGEILGTATGTGNPVIITIPGNQLPPDIIDVVVTLQNYLRYEGQVMVIPPTGPYVIKDQYVVNDAAGNNNGLPDFGEDILLSVSMKNVGVVDCNNTLVTLLSTDPFVVISDNHEMFGTIPANTSITMTDAFAFSVADNVSDGHQAQFSLLASNGPESWTSYLTLVLNAPALNAGSIQVLDPTGNNNSRLDPGETVTLDIITENLGHCDALNTVGTLTCTDPNITITSNTFNLNTINAGSFQIASFEIQVSPNAVLGSNIMFQYQAASGNYQASKFFALAVGIMAEDWETNNFSQFPWTNNSNVPWVITASNPYEGLYCAKSGNIGNNGNTSLTITLDIIASDTISFFRKVSSELDYDFLKFFIDGDVRGQWSGNVGWGRVAYPVTAGSHTFKWQYSKDGYQIGGSDAAWIDYVVFPPFGAAPLQVTATASPATICEGASTQLNALPTGGTLPFTYTWSPAASLSNPAIANPVANPLASTVYTVSVTDLNNTTSVATILVSVNSIPAIPATPAASVSTVCQGTASTLINTGIVPGAINYSWSVTPPEAGSVNGSGTSAWANWNQAYNGPASISVKANNSCGQSASSPGLTITVLPKPDVSLAPLSNVCVYSPPLTLSGGNPSGGVYSGNGVTAGMFNPASTGNGTFTINYTFTDGNGCQNTASQGIFVDPCIGLEENVNSTFFQLYPNPTQGIIHLKLNTIQEEPLQVQVSNALGKTVLELVFKPSSQQGECLIDLSTQAEGLYFIRVKSAGNSYMNKVLVH